MNWSKLLNKHEGFSEGLVGVTVVCVCACASVCMRVCMCVCVCVCVCVYTLSNLADVLVVGHL